MLKRLTAALSQRFSPGFSPWLSATPLQAVELKVIAGGSMTALLNELTPPFEKATGHKLSIHFDSTPNIVARVNAGTPFDVVVVPVDVFKDAAAKAHFAPGPTIDIARVGYGVAIRAGAPKPDISTADALKENIAHRVLDRIGARERGRRLCDLKVFERLGIADEMKAKTKVQPGPPQIAPAVAKGEAELGVFLTNVLIAPGVELAGAFPAELQQELVFTARPLPPTARKPTLRKR